MSQAVTTRPGAPLRGTLRMPGDKSISHRALLFHTLASGPARIRGLLRSEDVGATLAACRALGAVIEEQDDELVVRPPPSLREPVDVIDCGNSGTSMRLLAGILAALDGHAVLTGDASLRRRPMGRVVEPLRRMGARIDGRLSGELAPLAIRGTRLRHADHDLPVPSAQVKSALLLAGLRCGVTVREPRRSRDHTERLLRAMGVILREQDDGRLILRPTDGLEPVDIDVPGDLSAAAFPLVAAALVPGSDVLLEGVGMNPSRAGIVDALTLMGADLEVQPRPGDGPEPWADLRIRGGPLRGVRIDGELALRCLDELPILAVAAAFAEGETVIADAEELRVKESDRVARVCEGLRRIGAEVEERRDGMVIWGTNEPAPLTPPIIDASGDHRIAMAFAVAGLRVKDGVTVTPASVVRSSYPGFFRDLAQLRGEAWPDD